MPFSLSLSHSPRLILPQNGGAAPYLARNNLQFDYLTENLRALRSNTYIHERARERVEKVRVGHCSCREPRRGRRPLSHQQLALSSYMWTLSSGENDRRKRRRKLQRIEPASIIHCGMCIYALRAASWRERAANPLAGRSCRDCT